MDNVKKYVLATITLVFALCISLVAAFYSVSGLMAIFSGAAFAVAVMGGSLEIGKLVAASWLYNNWKECPVLMKTYLTFAVFVLMLITSMGIFGFLSKAHFQSLSPTNNNQAKIEKIEFDIQRQEKRIVESEKILEQFDAALSKYVEKGYVTRGLKEREKQAEERTLVQQEIKVANEEIDKLSEEKFKLETEVRNVEVEVGPLKYVAEMIYGDSASGETLDKAVRLVILVLIFVFDPLAVLLVIAGNMSFAKIRSEKKKEHAAPVTTTSTTESELIPVYIEEDNNSSNSQPKEVIKEVVVEVEKPVDMLHGVDMSAVVSNAFDKAHTTFNLSGPDGAALKKNVSKVIIQDLEAIKKARNTTAS